MKVLLPPNLKIIQVFQDGKEIPHEESGRYTAFALEVVQGKTHTFSIQHANYAVGITRQLNIPPFGDSH